MQDVIFSGTQLRKPVGSAYVAITLDNSDHSLAIDFDEVTVARRIYRSGESEYLINGAVCRLKDVNELFYDTGIGKEGYSIIGQGQIDKILSGILITIVVFTFLLYLIDPTLSFGIPSRKLNIFSSIVFVLTLVKSEYADIK